MKKGDILINQIMTKKYGDESANDLLREFHRGYPIENLRYLILSEDVEAVKIGVWIASELGAKCYPLLEEIVELLNHKMKYVRFFSIDCVLSCTTKENGSSVAEVMLLLNDSESAIRWKTLQFLMRASTDQLQGALIYFERMKRDSIHIRGIRLLIEGGLENYQEMFSLMKSEQPVLKRYGVAAAARILDLTTTPLQFALSLDEQDIKDFAEDVLQARAK